ncbi:hypothetical protein MHI57_24630 [Cytobacillus sp. FSL K6-0129]|uniref:hypothetical protein n=1 Tax=Cytobacillus sp. FSL K6-0129 TaxID=2921421 RepID=UPI0030FAA738
MKARVFRNGALLGHVPIIGVLSTGSLIEVVGTNYVVQNVMINESGTITAEV